ncbi:hypothetical protein [Sphingomonas sp.]|uniref:hypothetical protein n=1 Tax=Sphingomonas sp. TaxID=28214 RepID=UPI003B3B8377
MSPPALDALVAEELGRPVDPRVAEMAAAIAARHPTARTVLYYGSTLREARLDGLMLDFYLIVGDYRAAFGKAWLALANRLLPPNVFPFEHKGLVAKYAVLSEGDFARLTGPDATSVSVWARFAQPSRLAWVADAAASANVVATVARAAPTLFTLTLPMMADADRDVLAIWRRGFGLTYNAELRAERTNRSGSIVDADPDRYRRFGDAALATLADAERPRAADAARRWRGLSRRGKALTLLRLAKASATYADGIDYLAWKIARHSGHPVVIRPWQRRWPILGAVALLPRLLAKGAIR